MQNSDQIISQAAADFAVCTNITDLENAKAKYLGKTKVELTHANGAQIITAAPASHFGNGSSFSPTDLLASSLVSCILTKLAVIAHKEQIDLSGMKAEYQKFITAEPRIIQKISINILLPESLNEISRKLLQEEAASCAVSRSLSDKMNIVLNFQ